VAIIGKATTSAGISSERRKAAKITRPARAARQHQHAALLPSPRMPPRLRAALTATLARRYRKATISRQ